MTSVLGLVANSGDGVCAVDLQQRIVLWNDAAARLLGYAAEDVLGRFCFQIFAGRGDSGSRLCRPQCAQMTSALNQEPIFAFEIKSLHHSGQPLWLSMSTIVVPSRWSELSVLIHLFREISQQKEIVLLARQLLALVAKWSSSRDAEPSMLGPTALSAGGLTLRESEVLRLLGAGSSTARIADSLRISPATARVHIRKILSKLGVHSRLEAVTLAIREGLI